MVVVSTINRGRFSNQDAGNVVSDCMIAEGG